MRRGSDRVMSSLRSLPTPGTDCGSFLIVAAVAIAASLWLRAQDSLPQCGSSGSNSGPRLLCRGTLTNEAKKGIFLLFQPTEQIKDQEVEKSVWQRLALVCSIFRSLFLHLFCSCAPVAPPVFLQGIHPMNI